MKILSFFWVKSLLLLLCSDLIWLYHQSKYKVQPNTREEAYSAKIAIFKKKNSFASLDNYQHVKYDHYIERQGMNSRI